MTSFVTATFQLLFIAGLLFGLPVAIGVRARRRGRDAWAVVSRSAVAAVGAIMFGYGLLLLAFNGYREDYGSSPSQTLVYAIPALLLGSVMILLAWLAKSRR